MTRTFLKTLTTGLVAATIATAGLTVPAAAGGSVSLSFTPSNQREAAALRTGLGVYSVIQGVRNGASVRQIGRDNFAGLAQNGSRNTGLIHQRGDGHSASLEQNGNGNSHGIFQFGRGTGANVVQNGNGRTGATVQFGW